MLSLLIFLPLVLGIFIYFLNEEIIKIISSCFAFIIFALSVYCFLNGEFRFNYTLIKAFNFGINLRADNISFILAITANFMLFVSLLFLNNHKKDFAISAMILSACMNGLFLSNDALLFYIFWEVSLLPLLYLMAKDNLFDLAKKFFVFAFCGSIFMLVGIIYLAYEARVNGAFLNFDMGYFKPSDNVFLFLGFFLAFAIKAPIFPFHSWAIKVYSKSNNFVSVMLASFKMAPFGMIKFCVPLFSSVITEYSAFLNALFVISALYAAILAFNAKNYKDLIALSSISHLGIIVLGIFSMHENALYGAVFYMLSHAITSGGMFLYAEILKDNFKSYEDINSLALKMPFLTFIFAIFLFSSISLPASANFIGEFLVLYGVFAKSKIIGVFATLIVIFSAIYMLNMFRNMFLSGDDRIILKVGFFRIFILSFLAFLIIYLGINPDFIRI